MNDTELFELCKEVYERTEWGFNDQDKIQQWFYEVTNRDQDTDKLHDHIIITSRLAYKVQRDGYGEPECPLYTSDYLLEKLPKGIRGDYINIFNAGIKSWCALYGRTTTAQKTGFYGESSTPLKSLLYLTIALHKAGELHD